MYATGELVADRYRIVRLLGRGGMGEVYEAHDRAIDEPVALKTLPLDRADAADRLDRELVLARRIVHRGVCRLFDLGVDERGRRFVTMERLHGETLAEHLARRGALPPAEVATIVTAVAEALAAAHDAGVVHRDLKPHNVFLTEATDAGPARIVIMDFGLARQDGDDRASATDFAGTPAYMAPEQLTSRTVTTAADVYALGVVAFELLTGALPFAGETPIATALSRLQREPPPLRAHGGPDEPGWDRLIAACLAVDPADRPSAASVPALIAAGGPPAPPRSRWRRAWVAAPVLAIAAGATYAVQHGRGGDAPALDRGARVPFAFALGGLGADNINAIGWSPDGDLVLGGHVAAGARLAGHALHAARASSHGAYVARTSKVGRVRWIWRAAGDGDVRVTGLAVAADGDVVVSGSYYRQLDAGTLTLPASTGETSGFVIKLDGRTGAVRWARTIAASKLLFLRTAAIGDDGTIYVGGEYAGALTFAGSIAEARGPRGDSRSPVVAAFTADGEERWLVAGHGAGAARAFGLAAGEGRVIVSGIVWGPVELAGTPLPTRPQGDATIVALDAATGALVWHRELQSSGPREASSADAAAVVIDHDRVVVAGTFQRGMVVGDRTLVGEGSLTSFAAELALRDGAPR